MYEMRRKLLVFKSALGWMFSVIVVAFIVNVLANYFTKDKIRVEFRLEGTIVIGAAKEGVLDNLELRYNDEKIKNVQKISWVIVNKKKGIGKINDTVKIKYPRGLNILEVKMSERSPRLKTVDSFKEKEEQIQAFLNEKKKCIEIKNLETFNKNDFVNIDVYVKDVKDEKLSENFLKKWDLFIDATDVDQGMIEKVIKREEIEKSKVDLQFIIFAIVILLGLFIMDWYYKAKESGPALKISLKEILYQHKKSIDALKEQLIQLEKDIKS